MRATLSIVAVLTVGLAHPAAAAPSASRHYWVDQLRLEQAWELSTGDGVTVGVLDTGVNSDHPNLAGAVLAGRAFPDQGLGARDAWGHGTAVAMLIAGRGDRGATRGVAPGSRILPVTTSGTSSAVNEAIHWLVDQGADVINLSVGRSRPSPSSAAMLDEAIGYAVEHDVVVVAAAGNSGTDNGVTTPADRAGVLAVSAVDDTGRFRADVSVSGPEVALSAPGLAVVTAGEAKVDGQDLSPNGTSYSAALVSGVFALVRAEFPAESAGEAIQRVLNTARPAGPDGRDPEYGFGIVDPVAALTAPAAERPSAPARRWPLWAGIPVALVILLGTGSMWRRSRRTTKALTGSNFSGR